MEIISGNILLIQGPEGISLYLERVTSCITDGVVIGAVQTALSPTEASLLAHALLVAARKTRVERNTALYQSIGVKLRSAECDPLPPWEAA